VIAGSAQSNHTTELTTQRSVDNENDSANDAKLQVLHEKADIIKEECLHLQIEVSLLFRRLVEKANEQVCFIAIIMCGCFYNIV